MSTGITYPRLCVWWSANSKPGCSDLSGRSKIIQFLKKQKRTLAFYVFTCVFKKKDIQVTILISFIWDHIMHWVYLRWAPRNTACQVRVINSIQLVLHQKTHVYHTKINEKQFVGHLRRLYARLWRILSKYPQNIKNEHTSSTPPKIRKGQS